MGNPISGIVNAVSSGINAVEDLAKGDIGGALSSGVGALAGGFLAANPEIGMGLGMLGPLSGALGSLAGQAGASPLGGAGQQPSIFSGISDALGGLLKNPLGALGNLFGSNGAGATPGAAAAGGSAGLPDVNATLGSIQDQIKGQLGLQQQMAQFQIQVAELTSLINDLKTMGTEIARNI